MTKIKCNVYSCKYNKYLSCLKDNIEVSYDEIKTKCSSYEEKVHLDNLTEFSYLDFPLLLESNVKCNVNNCYYYKNNKCSSRKILIDEVTKFNTLKTICMTYRKID